MTKAEHTTSPEAPRRQRVCVAMSGGVDSSLAAALLVDQGYEVVGCTLHLWDYPDDGSVQGRCCAPEDIHDARRVADFLGIAYYAFDRCALFQAQVVEPFVQSYLEGETPSPCVRCNRGVKIPELLAIARRLGCEALATGHYARMLPTAHGPGLFRALDHGKDQSYFLHALPSETLQHLRFPLGSLTKSEVRRLALDKALPGANKGESQELCFVPRGRYDSFVAERAGAGQVRSGPIVDSAGKQVGEHTGIHAFTVGQRRRLQVALPERAYVVEVDATTATVHLGSREQLLARGADLTDLVLGSDISLPVKCDVAVRYRGQLHPAQVRLHERGARVTFEHPVQAVVRGQVAVFYSGERVLGGGTISHALGAESSAAELEAVC